MPDENLEIVRRLHEHLETGEMWAIEEALDPDVEWHWPPDPAAGVEAGVDLHSADVVATALRRLSSWERFWIEAQEFVETDDDVVVSVTHRARMKGSDEEIHEELAYVWTLKDGKVTRFRTFADRSSALAAARTSD
jgi:uncharacterized protein